MLCSRVCICVSVCVCVSVNVCMCAQGFVACRDAHEHAICTPANVYERHRSWGQEDSATASSVCSPGTVSFHNMVPSHNYTTTNNNSNNNNNSNSNRKRSNKPNR
uniref:Putative serine/threonine-protein kinase yaka n=1 Tax=Anopheles darlingi TaxID=43151 RepID=A0A2M4DJA8_ANODA